MPDKPNNPLNFWQELKRRKVVRVIIVYAAVSFVILELASIIQEPFGLPDWTIRFVFIILLIGLIITIILTWIYDITPQGIEKTKPVHDITEKVHEKPSGFNAWKIATIISVVVIVGLIIFHAIGERKQDKYIAILDKSIAVLPFKSLSADPDKQYLADAVMDAILLHLSKIEDLRVMPRTSIEQYRETDKTVTTICQELDIAYLLEGSFQMYGDQVNLIVQLTTPGKEDHIWASEYNRNWKDIFAVQSEVAQTIASELEAVITPKEKQLIEKVPTHNLTAYDFYQRGREEHIKYWVDRDKEAQVRAEYFYNKSLEEDPTFAKAYTGLTLIYYENHYFSSEDQNILDSILTRTEIALSLDSQEEDIYRIRAHAYHRRGEIQKAKENYETALNINPNDALALRKAGLFYIEYLNNYVKGLSCLHKAASIERSPYLAVILRSLAKMYLEFGFFEKANYYNQEATILDTDSMSYYSFIASIKSRQDDPTEALKYRLKVFSMDTTNNYNLRILGLQYLKLGQFVESIKYFEKYLEVIARTGQINTQGYRIGYAYWKAGYEEKAEYYFNESINFENRENELRSVRSNLYYTYFYLTQTYAFLGDEDKAFENLRIFNQKQTIPYWMVSEIKNSPLFDNIRDEPEFQQIVRDVETKYKAEHERVRQWLEENDKL